MNRVSESGQGRAREAGSRIRIHFPRLEGFEGRSKETRLVLEGLQLHPKIILVDEPGSADYLLLLQGHLGSGNPEREHCHRLKDRYLRRTIMLDFEDSPGYLRKPNRFEWFCYFKRSVVIKEGEKLSLMDYGDRPVEPISYGANYNYLAPDIDAPRDIDVACLFASGTIDHSFNAGGRGRVLQFLRSRPFPGRKTLFDAVSRDGRAGRSVDCPVYFETLKKTKILVTCNPSRWEGDSRLWEALASGCLVFVDRMLTPVLNPLIDHRHLVYYDLTDDGLEKLHRQIMHFLENDGQRRQIAGAGHQFTRNHHMSVHRIQQVVDKIELLEKRSG